MHIGAYDSAPNRKGSRNDLGAGVQFLVVHGWDLQNPHSPLYFLFFQSLLKEGLYYTMNISELSWCFWR